MHILDQIQSVNDMPHVITGPGDYITRDGKRVTIHSVQPKESPYTFKAKGSTWKMFRGKMRPRGFEVWHTSGRLDMVKEKSGDIVATW